MEAANFENKHLIGDKELISFPNLKRNNVVARIDSGAKSSSAHCEKIWVERMGGEKVLCCYFLKRSKKVTRFKNFKTRSVKSSNGESQKRYVVRMTINLGPITKRTDVTLTNRSTMNYSVLLGRRFLRNDFIIDVSKSYILTKNL